MTSQARGIKQEGLNDTNVADFLQTHPDFFERNAALLAKLRLPHLRDMGATVSLVERQVEVLREDFDAMHSVLVLFLEQARTLAPQAGQFLRSGDPTDADIKTFESLLQSGKPRCGQVRDAQRDYLFGKDSVAIGSVALTPLGPKGELGILAIGGRG